MTLDARKTTDSTSDCFGPGFCLVSELAFVFFLRGDGKGGGAHCPLSHGDCQTRSTLLQRSLRQNIIIFNDLSGCLFVCLFVCFIDNK